MLRLRVIQLPVIDLVAGLTKQQDLGADLDRVRLPASAVLSGAAFLRVDRDDAAATVRLDEVKLGRDPEPLAGQFDGTGGFQVAFGRERGGPSPGIDAAVVVVAFYRVGVAGPETIDPLEEEQALSEGELVEHSRRDQRRDVGGDRHRSGSNTPRPKWLS